MNKTYVWTGAAETDQGLSATNLNGSYNNLDFTRLTQGNYWNNASNWLERMPSGGSGGGSGGASGGGQPGPWFYMSTTSYPTTGDDAIFKYLEYSPIDGVTANLPVNECLFGGISGSWWGLSADGVTAGALNKITVEDSYFHGANADGQGHTSLYLRHWEPSQYNDYRARLGKNISNVWQFGDRTGPAAFYDGLNINASTFNIDSYDPNEQSSASETLINLNGDDFETGTLYHTGCGQVTIGPMKKVDNLIIHGRGVGVNTPAYVTKTPRYWVRGEIGQYLRLECEELNYFRVQHNPVSNAIPYMVVANRANSNNKYDLENTGVHVHGSITKLEAYPAWMDNNNNPAMDGPSNVKNTMGSRIRLHASGNQTNYITNLIMKEYNPYYSIPLQVAQASWAQPGSSGGNQNSQIEFESPQTATTLLANVNIEAGYFAPIGVEGKIVIHNGDLQSDGVLDYRWMPSSGVAEIVGHSGGTYNGEGVFSNSLNSYLYLPAGVDVSFRQPSGGATASLTGGIGLFAAGK